MEVLCKDLLEARFAQSIRLVPVLEVPGPQRVNLRDQLGEVALGIGLGFVQNLHLGEVFGHVTFEEVADFEAEVGPVCQNLGRGEEDDDVTHCLRSRAESC